MRRREAPRRRRASHIGSSIVISSPANRTPFVESYFLQGDTKSAGAAAAASVAPAAAAAAISAASAASAKKGKGKKLS